MKEGKILFNNNVQNV